MFALLAALIHCGCKSRGSGEVHPDPGQNSQMLEELEPWRPNPGEVGAATH
jgi:hypothetical protein